MIKMKSSIPLCKKVSVSNMYLTSYDFIMFEKPLSRALEQVSLHIDILKLTIQNTSAKTPDALVDSVFEFVDLPLPSQVGTS